MKDSVTCGSATARESSSLSLRMSESTLKASFAVPSVGAARSKATSAESPGFSVDRLLRWSPCTFTPCARDAHGHGVLLSRSMFVSTTPAVAASPTRIRRGRAVRTLMGFCTRISPSAMPKVSSFTATAVERNFVSRSGSLKRHA